MQRPGDHDNEDQCWNPPEDMTVSGRWQSAPLFRQCPITAAPYLTSTELPIVVKAFTAVPYPITFGVVRGPGKK